MSDREALAELQCEMCGERAGDCTRPIVDLAAVVAILAAAPLDGLREALERLLVMPDGPSIEDIDERMASRAQATRALAALRDEGETT